MKTTFSRALASFLMLLFALSPVWATCGGGGGGGTGGVGGGSGNGPTATVYNVPWKIWEAKSAPSKGLVLYWFHRSLPETNRAPGPLKVRSLLPKFSMERYRPLPWGRCHFRHLRRQCHLRLHHHTWPKQARAQTATLETRLEREKI